MGNDNSGKFIVSASQYLGLIILMSTLFIGITYFTDGNIVISIPVTIVLSALFFILVNFFIKEKRNMSRGGYKSQTIILFIFYIILAIPASLISTHAINVELFEKENIKQISKNRIDAIYALDEWYADKKDSLLDAWRADMESHVSNFLSRTGQSKNNAKAKLQGFPFQLPIEEITRNNKNVIIQMKMEDWNILFEDGIRDLIVKKDTVISQNTKALKNWNRFSINEKFKNLEAFVLESKEKMETFFSDQCRIELKFDLVPYTKEITLLNQPIALFAKHLNPISIGIILAMQFLILLPYFLTKKTVYNKKGFFGKAKKNKQERETYGSGDDITGTEI